MDTRGSLLSCQEPRFEELVGLYGFDELGEPELQLFEMHVLHCDACWRRIQRLQEAVALLRTDSELARRAASPEVVGALGMSGRLDRPFAGHAPLALAGCALFALLFAVPVLVEVAYQFDRYGSQALRLAPAAFGWMLAFALGGLWLDARLIRKGRTGIGWPVLVWLTGTAALSVAMLVLLPSTPTVHASFGTWPAHFGYLKSVLYAWLIGPLFLLWPFHFIVVMQQQLAHGRFDDVRALLAGEKLAVVPRGTGRPRVWALSIYLAALFVFNYAGVNHLFGALQSGPYENLFSGLVLVRATIWLLLPTLCLWWFANCVNELKRECLAMKKFESYRGRSS